MPDVVVVGGGPIGCYAAKELAGEGVDVLVLEEHPTIGKPVDCSGVIGCQAFDLFDLPRGIIRGEVRDLTLISPSGLKLTHRSPHPLAFVVDRVAFDQALAERALKAGAMIQTGYLVLDVVKTERFVEVTVEEQGERRTIRSQAAILAHGPRYRLQEKLGMGKLTQLLQTAQVEMEIEGIEATQVRFGRRIAPGSFAWLVPFRQEDCLYARIGVSAQEPATPYLKRLLGDLVSSGQVKEEVGVIRSWIIPIRSLPQTFTDRVLAVGDAAGQAKPTTGGGLFYGLLCAQFASRTLIEAFQRGDLSARTLSRYEARWRDRLGGEFRIGAFFRRLFEKMRDEEINQAFRVVSSDGIFADLSRKANFDWHQEAILFTLRHPSLGRLFLTSLFR